MHILISRHMSYSNYIFDKRGEIDSIIAHREFLLNKYDDPNPDHFEL